MEDPRRSSGINAKIVRGDAKDLLFLEPGKRILVQGNCVLCGFQNSADVIIKGKCKKSNFDQITKMTIDGNVSNCVFNLVSELRIEGSAKNCVFIGMQKKDIRIIDGTEVGCTLDGEPFSIVPRSVQRVFSFGGGPVVMQQRQVPRIVSKKTETSVVKFVKSGGGSVSWGNIKIKGSMSLRGATIEVSGPGTIGDIPVTAGRYSKRPGDSSNTLYRQDLSASPSASAWQVYENGEWVPSQLNPTIDSCIACNTNQATQICGHCFNASYCSEECAKAHWPEHMQNGE